MLIKNDFVSIKQRNGKEVIVLTQGMAMEYIYHLSNIYLFILLNCIFIPISIIALYIVKRFIPLDIRYKDNSVIGDVSALISIIYGVLVGLTALYLINNNNYTADAVQREANAVANIYQDSKWLKNPTRNEIQTEVKKYIDIIINIEWALMNQGKADTSNNLIIENMTNALLHYKANGNFETLLLRDMIAEIKMLYDARQQRIHMSYAALSPEIWTVILIGTILTIMINYIFGMNFYLHIVTVSAVALMASSMLFLLITLDRPFEGDFVIEPDAFRSVLALIKNDTANDQNTRAPSTPH